MKTWKVITLAVGIPLLVMLLIVATIGVMANKFARSMEKAAQVDTDPANFQDNLKEWQSTGLVTHFPPTIPSSATSVTFCESPGFMQADPYIQLRLVLPAAEVARLESQYSHQAIGVFSGGGDRRDHLKQDGGLPTTYYRTASPSPSAQNQQPGVFPADFSFYVLSAMDTSGDGRWRAGRSSGVAINPKTNEVVYWAEMW